MDRTVFESQFTATTAVARDLLIKQAVEGHVANAAKYGLEGSALGAAGGAVLGGSAGLAAANKLADYHAKSNKALGGVGGGLAGATIGALTAASIGPGLRGKALLGGLGLLGGSLAGTALASRGEEKSKNKIRAAGALLGAGAGGLVGGLAGSSHGAAYGLGKASR